MSFIWPSMLLSLLIMPVLIGGYLWLFRRKAAVAAQRATSSFTGSALVQAGTTSPSPLGRRRHLPFIILGAAVAVLLVALARPSAIVDLPQLNGTIILAFDVSSSMTADDLKPTRMEAAKVTARRFVDDQPATVDIGVVAFSNGGVVVQQPTDVKADVLSAITRLEPDGGTSLGHGLFTSLSIIAGETLAVDGELLEAGDLDAIDVGYYGSAAIVLLSDGEDQSVPDPIDVSLLVADAGVRVFPIGIGSEDGTIVELDGFSVSTRLDEELLEEIARVTGGEYFRAADEEDLAGVYDSIDLQLTVRGEEMEITGILAGLSGLLVVLGGAMSMVWFGRVP